MLKIPYALSVYNSEEINAVTKVLKEHRSNMGNETKMFENSISALFGKKYGIMVNSGSSANFLAIKLLNLPPGSEVITPVLTFSTTVAPIIQHHLIPVFVDVIKGKYIIDVNKIERMITRKTKAIMIPLLQGNIPDMERLKKITTKHKLFFIEDSCDTLGATFKGNPTGIFSDISTTSFFGSHIITAGGNGGMIMVNKKKWADEAKVLRGWGRSSSLFGESELISKRFKKKLGSIPYDAKFIFQDIGYNFLPNEMCAAFGNIQLKKLNKFRKIRQSHFKTLSSFFKSYSSLFILPTQDKYVKTTWLAFPLTIKKTAPFSRLELVQYLEKNDIQTRPIFTGNILKQPGFKYIPNIKNQNIFPIADEIMELGFLIGCHQGLEKKHIEKIKTVFKSFFRKYL